MRTPIPPAPTKPSTEDARMFISKRKRAVAIIDGIACGRMDARVVWRRVAPTEIVASRGASAACSIASANNLPTIPIE